MEVNQKLMNDSEQKIRAELDKMDLSIDEYENELDERLAMIDAAKTTVYKLTPDEEVALVQIDAMKEVLLLWLKNHR